MPNLFDVKISSNLNNVSLKIARFSDITAKAARKAFYDIGKTFVEDAKRYVKEPKHGRVYLTRIGKSKFRKFYHGWGELRQHLSQGKQHIASAAGEAPAILTGKLMRSINFKVTGTDRLDFGVSDELGCDYAKHLEYTNLIAMSGRATKNIAPRPFISRSYNANKTKLITRMQQAIQESIK